MNGTESTQSREKQDAGIEEERNSCLLNHGIESLLNTTPPVNDTRGLMCPAYFDGIMCWPPTKPGTLSMRKCPLYVIGIVKRNNATRFCTETGHWYKHTEYRTYWTNYSLCYTTDLTTIVEDLPNINVTIIHDYLPFIKRISFTGYAISLCALIVALIIMLSIRKLHCARNKLHMHLFASFILRAGLSLVKDFSFIEGVGLAGDLTEKNGKSYFYVDVESNNWQCKCLTSLWEYFITANYSWILMEGLYLHNLIFRALFTDASKKITSYIAFGWGLPATVILSWVFYRIHADDTLCWTTHSKVSFMIIRIPTSVAVLINMVLFLRITTVIFNKLQAPMYEMAQRYRKWARSTLVLVPLFGIHYGLFLGMSFYIGISEVVELVWLIGDQIFASFQGFFVAVLYCFLNGEVRTELKPHLRRIVSRAMTNSFCHLLYPCRDVDLKSSRCRASVCTTVSCSSLYNTSSQNRHGRQRFDCKGNSLRNKDEASSHAKCLQEASKRDHVVKKHSTEIINLDHYEMTENDANCKRIRIIAE